ncbi:MAG TPA: von Willebrand factor type A domain-containing protein [Nocardioidaceae bacterium]|nr:von Willebrand factor type A domain-containing protein [Nocardioidaceae bacterium]
MRRQLTTAAIILLIAATGCSNASNGGDTSREDIDARAYFEQYETDRGDDGGMVAMSSSEDGAKAAGPETAAAESRGDDQVRPCNDCGPPPKVDPPITSGNTFENHGTNPVVRATDQPRSTFALDVDDGSYRVAQRFLDDGTLPPAASVRPEEWINAYAYGDSAPSDSDLGVTAETAAATKGRKQWLRVGVNARELSQEKRDPAALTFVVDTSGSMDIRERLGLVKSSLALLTKNLRPDDKIAIVTYDDKARSVLEPTRVSQSDKILDAIDDLEPGGGTNLAAGVELGYEYASESAGEAGINAVVLASDGVANIGPTNPGHLANKVDAAASKNDIHLVTVGYGMGNYNDDLMEQLADQGQGFYSYVSTFDDAKQLFVEDLTSTLAVVARDAKAQVTFDPEVVESYRLVGYENRALTGQQFDDESTDAGEVGAGMDVTALYEVTPTRDAASGAVLGSATVRWRGAGGKQHETSSTLRMPGVSAAQSDAMRLATTVAEFAETVKKHQGKKDFDARLRTLQKTADELAQADVAGADELSDMLGEALDAHPTGGPYEIQ